MRFHVCDVRIQSDIHAGAVKRQCAESPFAVKCRLLQLLGRLRYNWVTGFPTLGDQSGERDERVFP